MTSLCAVVLAAGEGRRLRPLTELVPKALCPVGNVPLLDLALARLAPLGLAGPERVAVNAWYLAEQVVRAVGDRADLSIEAGPRPLGTSGGVARLRDWIAGRGVLAVNADAYLSGGDLTALLAGWDGRTVRLLGVPDERPEFGRHRFAGCSLLPWSRVAELDEEPSELVRTVWRPAEAAGELTVVDYGGTFMDTGTPRAYLAANLHAAHEHAAHEHAAHEHAAHEHAAHEHAAHEHAAHEHAAHLHAANLDGAAGLVAPDAVVTGSARDSVVGPGAVVDGTVESCVVWPHSHVARGEHLTHAIRYGRSGTVTG